MASFRTAGSNGGRASNTHGVSVQMITIQTQTLLHEQSNENADRFPDCCPYCHRYLSILAPSGMGSKVGNNLAELVFRCVSESCQRLFIGVYKRRDAREHFILQYCTPRSVKPQPTSEEIRELSPAYVEIADQARAAEHYGLDQIAGTAYRKALEFLIKDYLISQGKNEKKVRSTLLGKCVEDYVEDPRVKSCAAKAAWLGNDETHYTRRWEDKDIHDLKTLINLTLHWIEADLLTAAYDKSMSSPTP